MKVQILREALQDLIWGYRFCEARQEGLGDHFLAGIHSRHLGYNRLLCKRFPFAVYYRVESDVARVHAVLDCRRDPSWIRQRLT